MDAGESESAEKRPTNNRDDHEPTLQRIDTWEMLHPEALQTSTQTPNQTSNPPQASRTDPPSTSSSSSTSSQDLLHEALNGESDAFIELKDVKDHDPSPMNAPPTQEMDRDASYNPERIPKHVFFSSEPSAPGDWSVVSNESLFSIHQGSNSFGGEQGFAEVSVGKEEGKGKGGSHDRVKAKSPSAGKLKGSSSSVSDGSECSDYSFAFPVLGNPTKAETRGSRNRPWRDQDVAAEAEKPPPPFPQKPTFFSRLFSRCCCCHCCLSCFSHIACPSCCRNISCPSCCRNISCPSCCRRVSCKSCCKNVSCPSCCRRVSCKSCRSRLSSLPCCSWPSCWRRR